jgi:spore coat polysaccharide biosynthesis predicted glycosyltransferase SpsG
MWLDPDSPEAAARLAALGLDCTADTAWPIGSWDGSLIDGYGMEKEAAVLAKNAPPMVVLDDFLVPPPGTSLVVNSAFHLTGDTINGLPALLGPAFALVDPRFSALPDRGRDQPVRKILVTFGRIDPDNATELVLEALIRAGTGAKITVVSSAASPHAETIAERVRTLGGAAHLVLDAPDLVPLLAETDLVVGAGGVSLMERIAAGIPSVTLAVAENQRLFVDGAARAGATLAGSTDLDTLLGDAGVRARMSEAGRQIIDGGGATRVAHRMFAMAEPGTRGRIAKGHMSR